MGEMISNDWWINNKVLEYNWIAVCPLLSDFDRASRQLSENALMDADKLWA